MKRTRDFKYYLASAVALLTFIVYLSALRNEFIEWDDRYYVFKNPFISSFNSFFFKWAFFDFYASNWHPLTWISHALDYAFWGLNPMGHHLTNNALHAINSFLVVFLVTRLLEITKEKAMKTGLWEFLTERTILIAGGVTGLLFGLHPLHVESVAWVSERKDLLCAMFFLLSIIQYMNYVKSADNQTTHEKSLTLFLNKHYLLTLGFFILALLSKPMAVTLPMVLLILDWYPLTRIHSMMTLRSELFKKLPFFALSLMSSILTFLAQRTGGALRSLEVAPLSMRLLVAAKAFILYLWEIIWPLNLMPLNPYPRDVSLFSFKYLSAVALVAGITIACIAIVKKQRIWLTAWGYYIVTLIPVIGIVQVGSQSMADRYMYLPSLGPFLIMGLGAAWIFEKAYTLKRCAPLIPFSAAIAIFVFISFLTIKQIGIWRNSFVFWNYYFEKEPAGNPISHINLGEAYEEKGLLDQAIEQYQLTARLRPGHASAHVYLGEVYKKKGFIDQAIEQYRIALTLNPDNFDAHSGLGVAYGEKGIKEQAIEQFMIALKLNPESSSVHANMGTAYGKFGLTDQALEQYNISLRLNPNNAQVRINLATIYEEKGLKDQAIQQYKIALRLNPSNIDGQNNLGLLYHEKGMIDKAIDQYQAVLLLDPNNAPAHYNLGQAYKKKGLIDQAIDQYRIVLRFHPDDFNAHSNLGMAYREKGMKDETIDQFRIVLSLKPGSASAHNNMGIAYAMFGLADKAIEQFRIAVKLDPSNPTWRSNLAKARERRRLSR